MFPLFYVEFGETKRFQVNSIMLVVILCPDLVWPLCPGTCKKPWANRSHPQSCGLAEMSVTLVLPFEVHVSV